MIYTKIFNEIMTSLIKLNIGYVVKLAPFHMLVLNPLAGRTCLPQYAVAHGWLAVLGRDRWPLYPSLCYGVQSHGEQG